MPGHEIVGRVTAVGKEVKKFKKGDLAAMGFMAGSCRTCPSCQAGTEQYCDNGFLQTYNTRDKEDGSITYGGFSTQIVGDENFVLQIPKEFKESDLAAVAPLLCAGITVYSPLRHWQAGKGKKVGVAGLGGLGHMTLKLARAMGAHVVLFTTSASKAEDGKRLGAHEVVISKNPGEMKKHLKSFDLIINTIAAPHSLDPYVELLKTDGTMCMIGIPATPHPSPNIGNLIFNRRCISGSLIGSIKETQEMLDFCAKQKILADIELIPMQKINEAFERTIKSDVKYRFVIDMASIK